MIKKILLAVLFAAGLSSFSEAMTVSDILSRARFYLKDQSTSASRQQFTDATLMTYVSDGQREANTFDWLLVQRTSFTLTANTTEYTLPADFVATTRVIYRKGNTNTYLKLDQTSFNQLDADSTGWMGTSAGTPQKYYVYLTTSPVIGILPAPTAVSTGTVQVDYVANTIDVTATTDTPFNGFRILAPYHPYLVYYVVCRAYMTLEETEMAGPFCDQWNQGIVVMKSGILKQPDFNPSFGGRRNQ